MESARLAHSAALRFAVLWHHQIAEPHFDLMVETRPGSDLATWRFQIWPIQDRVPATRLKDHRRIYLEYDGELTEGRGRVDRIDSGTCRVDIGEDAVWTIQFVRLPGVLRLERIEGEFWEANMCDETPSPN